MHGLTKLAAGVAAVSMLSAVESVRAQEPVAAPAATGTGGVTNLLLRQQQIRAEMATLSQKLRPAYDALRDNAEIKAAQVALAKLIDDRLCDDPEIAKLVARMKALRQEMAELNANAPGGKPAAPGGSAPAKPPAPPVP